MDRTDRLICNPGSRRILLFWLILLPVTALAAWFLADFLAGRAISGEIRAMLSAAGGGTFHKAADPQAVAAGEAMYRAYGISAEMSPHLMADFAPLRRLMFGCFLGFSWLILSIFAVFSLNRSDSIYRELDEMTADVLRLAKSPEAGLPPHGNETGSIRRLNDSISALSERTAHAAEQLRQEKRRMTDWLIDITHQIKNALAVIRLNRDMLDELTLPADEQTRLSAEITQNLDRTETLVLEALKLAKLDAGAVIFAETENDLAATCRMACHAAEPLLRAKNIRTEIVIEGEAPPILPHDRFWLCEAIGNLLKNAADHAECTLVTLTLEALPGAVRLTVADNGRGIPLPQLRTVFERFRSGSGGSSTNTGIGMAIARRIFSAHGAQLTVYSDAGRGTQFLALFLRTPNRPAPA